MQFAEIKFNAKQEFGVHNMPKNLRSAHTTDRDGAMRQVGHELHLDDLRRRRG